MKRIVAILADPTTQQLIAWAEDARDGATDMVEMRNGLAAADPRRHALTMAALHMDEVVEALELGLERARAA
jgi:hypothetical protein